MANRTVTLKLYIKPNYIGPADAEYTRTKTGPANEIIYLTTELPALPGAFNRAGYDFLGYDVSASATSPAFHPGDAPMFPFQVGQNYIEFSYYCIWKIKTYTVNYSANGGTGAPEGQTKTYGQSISLRNTAPTRAGYDFLGWSKSSTGAVVYQPGDTFSENENVTLYAIWTKERSKISTMTSPTEIGGQGTARWNIVDPAYTYKLELNYENAPTVTVNAAANSDSVTYTIPVTWLEYLPDSTQAIARATLTTYSGNEIVGTYTKNFTVSVPASIVPEITSFTAAPYSDNATVAAWGIFVQRYTKADLSVNATPGTGARIISIRFIYNSEEIQDSTVTTARTQTIYGYSDRNAEVIVTDSRGRTARAQTSFYVYPYSTPEVSAIDLYRCLNDGTRSDIEGTYARITPRFKFSDCNGNNSLTVNKISDKPHTGTTWTDVINGVTSGSSYTIGGNFTVTGSYDIRCMITDALGNTASLIVILPPTTGFALGLKNDRARFGGPTEKPGLQVDWISEFNDSTDFNGETTYNDKATFNDVIDITRRRCEADLTNTGWYRVIEFNGGYLEAAIGGEGFALDISITRTSIETGSSEAHKVTLLVCKSANYGAPPVCIFAGEESASGFLGIKKIRYNTSSDEKTGYIDIYYDLSGSPTSGSTTLSQGVTVNFAAAIRPEYQGKIAPVLFTRMNEAPTGETVQAIHLFAKELDANEITYTSLGKQWHLVKKNGIVYLNAPGSISSASQGTNYLSNTPIPEAFRPKYTCRFPVADWNAISSYYLEVNPGGALCLICGEQITSPRYCSITACWIAQ